MKIGIAQRLFLSILMATSLAILCIFLIMQWNINRVFIQYLNTLDQDSLRRASEKLAQSYADHGSWDFLRDNPRPWIIQMMAEHPDAGAASGRLSEYEHDGEGPPFPPPQGTSPGLRMRIILLDAEHKPIFGNPAETENANFKPLVHQEKIIGYVGLVSPKHLLRPPQVEFLKHLKAALIMSAFGLVLVVAIFSLPLASRLLRPIKAMALATRDLASGKYSIRVPIASSDELGQLGRDFNTMALTLEKNEKARRQWVADISHELRTPISVLRGEIEALLEGVRSTTPESIRSLHAEALRLQRLVEDLYQLSLSDFGALTYRKEKVDLSKLLKDSIETHRPEFARKGITISEDIADGLHYTVFADTERMYQLLGNLIDNSLKYTDEGGELLVSLACRGNRAAIDFQDSAPGVRNEELDKLFDRLYRVDSSRSRSSGGAGLGLAICKNIVEAHEGSISAHPSPLGGVLIRVTLPTAGKCS